MDSLGSLALATEPPTLALLKRKPQSKNEYIVSQKMVKHILGMSIYQCIVIFTIIFAGEYFVTDSDKELSFEDPKLIQKHFEDIKDECSSKEIDNALDYQRDGYIFPGRRYDWQNEPIYKCFYETMGASRHMSVVFNVFVLMQVFNMINARKIHDEVNICAGITQNYLFLGIWALIAGFQVIIAQYTGKVFEVNKNGLDSGQWMISLIFGAFVLLYDFFLKFIPDSICPELGKKINQDEEHKKGEMQKKSSSGPRRRIS